MEFLFLAISFFTIIFALGMIFSTQPSYSALYFIAVIMGIAGLFAILSATFLFMIQIIVYAGAIITLLLFIIMFLNVRFEELPKENYKTSYMLASLLALVPFNYLIFKAISTLPAKNLANPDITFGTINQIGAKLFQDWVFPFEMLSIILLIALVGSIVLAKRKAK